uniref:YqaJ viral recombinase domain-containing protein n=1 Tax=Amphimedon queenslandica TaxID=400682 RepID=A0A1X7UQ44_AMPQE
MAREAYKEITSLDHKDFVVACTGLHVSVSSAHLGASPDGLTSCSCCGKGIVKIKCPYSYYQVQGQMGIMECCYCDFVVWTTIDIFIERIPFDKEFFDSIKTKLDSFFLKVILPRVLVGEKKPRETHISKQGEFGAMIECDNPSCKFGWIHFGCVGLVEEPTGSWFCQDCI